MAKALVAIGTLGCCRNFVDLARDGSCHTIVLHIAGSAEEGSVGIHIQARRLEEGRDCERTAVFRRLVLWSTVKVSWCVDARDCGEARKEMRERAPEVAGVLQQHAAQGSGFHHFAGSHKHPLLLVCMIPFADP
jgi:hypothetical protein